MTLHSKTWSIYQEDIMILRCVCTKSDLNQSAFDSFTVVRKGYITLFKNLKWGINYNNTLDFHIGQVNMYRRWREGKRKGQIEGSGERN